MDALDFVFGMLIATDESAAVCGVVAASVVAPMIRRRRRALSTLESYSVAAVRFPDGSAAIGSVLALIGWAVAIAATRLCAGPWDAPWWRHAAPMFGAVVGLAVLAVRVTRKAADVEVPVVPVVRRTWRTFADPIQLRLYAAAAVSLLALSIACGNASIPSPTGSYAAITAGDSSGIASFYGWAYAVPVIITVVVVSGLGIYVLNADAAKPFSRPDTVTAGTLTRRATASSVLLPALGAVVLSLGYALSFVAGTGRGSAGFGEGEEMYMWSVGYSSLAPAIAVIGWALQTAAITLLLLMIARGLRQKNSSAHITVRA
ncbi:hypothetical protein [Rhodococcus sp. H29-C3]|uniref:hypothetical protein n=1 Tax=Rhodococcus sp. H29-C3 TaxID=3046307 RepID=UPI0024BACE53|nr:hypothetical protein [Rhodococcus sp. H29-C3]MDJ0362513.1 hypothetical protein [Rhodococcus sp. H29-C3]